MKIGVVEVLDRDGHARQVVPVLQWPVTIGRSVDADVVLDDPHIAAQHATISESDGVLALHVGDSVNGAELRGKRLGAGETAAIPAGEAFQLGATRLRVRRSGDALLPERALAPELQASRLPVAMLLIAFVALLFSDQWLRLDPGARAIEYIPILLLPVMGVTVWCLIWAIVSKIFRNRFEFWPHARIALGYLIAAEVVSFALPILAFMIGVAVFSRIAELAAIAVTCAMMAAHLTRVVPARRRAIGLSIAGLFIAGTAVMLTQNYQTQDRVFDELYVSALAPPALRLVSPVAPSQFIEETKGLKAILDSHATDETGPDTEFGEFEVMHGPGSRSPSSTR